VTWSSSVPGAIAGVLAAFRASADLARPVDIRDGPVVTGSAAVDAVIAGWHGMENDELAVEGQGTTEGLAGLPDREQYSIRCAAMSLSGTGNVVAARTRAYELLAACGAAIAADRTLGGAVMRASVGASSLFQEPADGMRAVVQFSVDCDAYTGR
jgi:hypothetical protein